MPRAVSKLGLAFVTWTRATTWSKFVFQSLPPLEDFLAVRLTKDFQAREAFEIQADALHDAFLERHGITEEAHLQGHRAHLRASLLKSDARKTSRPCFSNMAWRQSLTASCVGVKKELDAKQEVVSDALFHHFELIKQLKI